MATQQVVIAPHRFGFGYYRQTFWNWLIGSAFFLGGLGGGLFLVSLLSKYAPGMLIGFLIVVIGKNTAHMLFLGRPERFWRAAMRPDRSWIARGIWAMGFFALSGFLLLLPYVAGPQYQLGSGSSTVVTTIAVATALFIMFYDGFVMNRSLGVAFWRTLLLPILMLMYAALGGATLSIAIRELRGDHVPEGLSTLEQLLLVANLVLLLVYLWRMKSSLAAARETMKLWLAGPYARIFFGLVLIVGLLATLLLSIVESRVQASWLIVLIAACELTGDFSLVMLFLRSGLFPPQTAKKYQLN
jgi:formate-dependent nitrite reductase membrane component NrfD